MLVAVVLIALLTIIGATTLSVAGTDSRVATAVRRHHLVMNAADAGTQHGRWQIRTTQPRNEGWDTADTGTPFVAKIESDEMFAGTGFPMNQGNYEVRARFAKCSNPPPGYSTEIGVAQYRSDFWEMDGTARFTDAAFDPVNPMEAKVMSTVRKVIHGPCKIR
jgi:Tfp pilus assembly protein PilX